MSSLDRDNARPQTLPVAAEDDRFALRSGVRLMSYTRDAHLPQGARPQCSSRHLGAPERFG